jgi:DNA-binding cell septation regulator SpoVG
MTQNVSVMYFPPKQGSGDTDLGGGYLTSGIVKFSFRVIKTDKNANGWFLSLPRRKTDAGEWVDVINFVNKEAFDLAVRLVQEKMNGGTTAAATPATPAPAPASKTGQRQVPSKTPGNGVPGKAPW